MSRIRIFHNPRCSKSRAALALLEERGHTPDVILYLEQSPGADELRGLIRMLGCDVRDIIRKSESEYKAMGLDDPSLDDEQLIRALIEAPILIQRPIVVRGDRAVIGRPPERILELI